MSNSVRWLELGLTFSVQLKQRKKNVEDERNLVISITDKGMKLRDEALSVPQSIGSCIPLSAEEAAVLYKVLYKILNNLKN